MATQPVTTTNSQTAPIYAGAELLGFGVAEMPPNTKIYVYCNNINITPFCAPNVKGAKIGDDIVTNQLGTASGWLYIPSTDGDYKFLVGEILLTFSDSATGVANSKYIAETILYNHGLSLVDTEQGGTTSLRATIPFRTDPVGSSSEENKTLSRLDPLAQTFIVDSIKYPRGIYLTGINLFIYQGDDKLPIGIELRPVTAGKPSTTEYISGSYVLRNPDSVNVFDKAAGTIPPTVFTFEHPLYLKPGEYAFCVLTKSDKYQLLTAKSGDGNTVKQPFAGSLFKAQNTGDWTGDTNEDLSFVMRKAKFTTGTVVFEAVSKPIDTEIYYDKLRLLSTAVDFGDTATAEYKVTTKTAGTGYVSDPAKIVPGVSADITGRQVLKDTGDVKISIELTTKDKDISPMLDKQLMNAQIFKTAVTDYSKEISDSELKASNGGALARYISKPVMLADGFESTGIQVKLNVNRKIGTDIEVFCRVMSKDDKSLSNGIYDRPWVRVPLKTPATKTFAGTSSKFATETYSILEPLLNYDTTIPGTTEKSTYKDFSVYQIKVVFYSNNPVYMPTIAKLSATSLV
jgi:hypothetical protein